MSFILDALRKSENERRLEAAPGIMHSPSAVPRERLPLWAILAIAALAAAVLVLTIYSLTDRRGAAAPPPAVSRSAETARSMPEQPPQTEAAPAAVPPQAGQAPVELPVLPQPQATMPTPPEASAAPAREPEQTPAAAAASTAASAPALEAPSGSNAASSAGQTPIPSYAAVLAEGIGLGALQMQLHVHSSVPASRFIVVNGSRYLEGDRLSEGPVVEEIAAEGAILSYRGRRFLLTPN
ncbi:MAG: general secretion pathway protein GspB [Gammaproteobacteria bacterium]|jgi:general secretion pathway protein B